MRNNYVYYSKVSGYKASHHDNMKCLGFCDLYIFKDNELICHETLIEPMTFEEFKQHIDNFKGVEDGTTKD